MVSAHLPLVFRVARKLHRRQHGAETEDLVSAGTLGLVEAAERYDPERGIPFASFAYARILGAMLDELRFQRRIAGGAGEAEFLPLDEQSGDANLRLIDVTEDPTFPRPPEYVEFDEVVEAVKELPEREREMLTLRVSGYSVGEIAEMQGCSDSRASQVLTRAHLRLKTLLAA